MSYNRHLKWHINLTQLLLLVSDKQQLGYMSWLKLKVIIRPTKTYTDKGHCCDYFPRAHFNWPEDGF
jgi:hypothetical protein